MTWTKIVPRSVRKNSSEYEKYDNIAETTPSQKKIANISGNNHGFNNHGLKLYKSAQFSDEVHSTKIAKINLDIFRL